jgi:hypothetical protein
MQTGLATPAVNFRSICCNLTMFLGYCRRDLCALQNWLLSCVSLTIARLAVVQVYCIHMMSAGRRMWL